MGYQRPTNPVRLTKTQKLALLTEYAEYYRELAAADPHALNRKVPREAFAEILDRVGEVLIEESGKLAKSEGSVRQFLDDNTLPSAMAALLPDGFRTFCLALNALKQWVAAEQGATDRYLIGGVARQLCREAVKTCLVTGEPLGPDAELHHPVRDGRPPIALSKGGHASIEEQVATDGDDNIGRALISVRHERNRSWAHLRRGCLDLLVKPVPWPSKASSADARVFARKAATDAKTGYAEILIWLDERGL
ncbi:MAG: hypothetical protein ABSH28_21555 [Acidobacteriota bacterium]|jgi:hypothetical protein